MYSVSTYGKMIEDGPRRDAYVGALRKVIKPGSVMVDLGAGPGLFALLACQMGARRVYALEPDNVIQLAREAAEANGFADRIVFIQAFSTSVTLPEKADVIVSDLRGVLPWFQKHLPAISDVRTRMLASDGILIPQRDILWAALVEAPEKYEELVGVWKQDLYDLNFSAGRRMVTNTWLKMRVASDQLLVDPKRWYTLEYNQLESPDVRAEIVWNLQRQGTTHGVIVWFDSELVEGVGFSNRPGEPELVYGNAFFPFSEPIHLDVGDEVKLTISADLIGDDYVWRWNTCVTSQNHPTILKAEFKQSTFFSVPLSATQLRKRASNFAPRLNEEAQVTAAALTLMDGLTPLHDIARRLVEEFPARYTAEGEALQEVSELSQKYSCDE